MKKLFPYALSVAVLLSCNLFSEANQVVIPLPVSFSASTILGKDYSIKDNDIMYQGENVGKVIRTNVGGAVGAVYTIKTKNNGSLSLYVTPIGNNEIKVGEYVLDAKGNRVSNYMNKYNANNQLLKTKSEDFDAAGLAVVSVKKGYFINGALTSSVLENNDDDGELSSKIVTYVNNGKPTFSNATYYKNINGKDTITGSTNSIYAPDGKIAAVISLDSNGATKSSTTYDYNAGVAKTVTTGSAKIETKSLDLVDVPVGKVNGNAADTGMKVKSTTQANIDVRYDPAATGGGDTITAPGGVIR